MNWDDRVRFQAGSSSRWASVALFLLGLGSKTRVFFIGSLSLSEMAVFALAPIVFLRDYGKLKKDGFMPLIWMVTCLMMAMFVSAKWNHTAFPFVFKSFAVFYSVLAHIVVFHNLLRKNFNALWIFWLGFFFSSVITIFGLNPTVQVSDSGFAYIGQDSVDDVLNGQMFLMGRLKSLLQLPIFGWYLKIPVFYSVLMSVAYTLVMMLTTISGRSASLVTLLGALIILIGGKRRPTMRGIGKHLIMYAMLGFGVVLCYKGAYSYLARNGVLGEGALAKYEGQTQQGSGLIRMLISGRREFFIGLGAAIDNPFIGFGPHAYDEKGYVEQFFAKYGLDEGERYYFVVKDMIERQGGKMIIPAHSHIIGAWVHYGLFGLLFYVWVAVIIVQHFRRYAAAIPQWYGYFALTLISFLWDMFFSAFANRDGFAFMMVCLFFARAVGSGRIALPLKIELEACSCDSRR